MADDKETVEVPKDVIEQIQNGVTEAIPETLTRRQAIAMMAAAGIGSFGAGTASGGTNQAGTVGSDSSPVDLEGEDLDLTQQSNTPSDPGSGQVRFYAKSDGKLYKIPAGGSETNVGSVDGENISPASIDVPDLTLENTVCVTTGNNGNGVMDTYPPTAAGLADAFDTIEAGSVASDAHVFIPPADNSTGYYDLGSQSWDFAANSVRVYINGCGVRDPDLRFDLGVGAAFKLQGGDRIRNVDIRRKNYSTAATDGTEDDIAIHCAPGGGFPRFESVRFQGWWRNIYLDAHFNARIIDCDHESEQPGGGQGAAIYADTTNGPLDDTMVRGNFFGETNVPSIINSGANGTTVTGCDFEGVGVNAIWHDGGANATYSNLKVTRTLAGAGTLFDIRGGSGEINALQMRPGGGDYTSGVVVDHPGDSSDDGPWTLDNISVEDALGGHGVQVTVPDSELSNIRVDGAWQAPILIAGNDITLTGGHAINGGQSGGATYTSGVFLNSVTDCSIIGVRCYDTGGGTQDYGISTGGSSNYNNIVGCGLRGNVTAATNNLGANTATSGNVT